ncbi:chemotaxis protein CheX [Aeoliella sp.]|uniref:chemotaxis protein CheX n=1 Tax=Aeoliella sp. TaxID=2795800 RepID=UPI003CCBBB2A
MQAEWINPFVLSTVSTFETMLCCGIKRGAPSIKTDHQPNYEVSGLMSLEGKARGIVVVSVDRKVAIAAAEQIMGHTATTIDADVIDVVCEITNMVAGGANNRLEHLEMKIGLPSVVSGKNHVISYPSGVATISIPFETDWGPMCVDASIKESSSDENSETSNEISDLLTGANT